MKGRFPLLVVALLLAAACMSNASWAAGQGLRRVVFPTGQWPTDVHNVQSAVDLGGTVLLKATNVAGRPTAFNFGTPDLDDPAGYDDRQVFLNSDVSLVGEFARSSHTTIVGGAHTINVGLTKDFAVSPVSGYVRIYGIHFEGSNQYAIEVYRCSGLEIVGNRISDVIDEFDLGIAILIHGGGSEKWITGKVVVAGNVIEGGHAQRSDAILLADLAGDADIVFNRIKDIQSIAGIIVIRHVEGTVRIAHNFVAPGPGDGPDAAGNGIYIYSNDTWVGIRTSSPVYEVVDNRIVTDNPNATAIGLVGDTSTINAPLIERNHITSGGAFEAIGLYGGVSNARVAFNRIDGPGEYGISLVAYGDVIADSNTIVGNDFRRFKAATAGLFLDAHTSNTLAIGRFGTTIDLGIGNQIRER